MLDYARIDVGITEDKTSACRPSLPWGSQAILEVDKQCRVLRMEFERLLFESFVDIFELRSCCRICNDSCHTIRRFFVKRQVAVVTRMRSLTKARGEVSGSTMMLPFDASKVARRDRAVLLHSQR